MNLLPWNRNHRRQNHGRRRNNKEFIYRPYTRAMYYAELFDAWRVIPRIMLFCYAYLVFWIIDWFLGMPNPSTQQAALATTITGTVPAVIGLYQHTGRKWGGGIGGYGMGNVPTQLPMMPSQESNYGGREYVHDENIPTGETYGDDG